MMLYQDELIRHCQAAYQYCPIPVQLLKLCHHKKSADVVWRNGNEPEQFSCLDTELLSVLYEKVCEKTANQLTDIPVFQLKNERQSWQFEVLHTGNLDQIYLRAFAVEPGNNSYFDEQQNQADIAIGLAFPATVHRVNNLLNTVLGQFELCKLEPSNPQYERDLFSTVMNISAFLEQLQQASTSTDSKCTLEKWVGEHEPLLRFLLPSGAQLSLNFEDSIGYRYVDRAPLFCLIMVLIAVFRAHQIRHCNLEIAFSQAGTSQNVVNATIKLDKLIRATLEDEQKELDSLWLFNKILNNFYCEQAPKTVQTLLKALHQGLKIQMRCPVEHSNQNLILEEVRSAI